MVIRILMEFVMLFSTIGSSPVRNPLLFLFSILPIRFKDRFILKKKKNQRSKNIEHLLSNALCVAEIHESGEKRIYRHPRRLKNKSPREKKAQKLVDRSLSLTMEQSVSVTQEEEFEKLSLW